MPIGSGSAYGIREVKTGWILSHSYEEEVPTTATAVQVALANKRYCNDEYAFSTLDEALSKVKELATAQ